MRYGFWHSKRGAKCELPRGRAPSSSSTSSTNGSQRKKTKRGKVGKWEKEVGLRDPQGVSDQSGCQETEGGLKSNNKEDGYLQRGRLLAKKTATYKEDGCLQRGRSCTLFVAEDQDHPDGPTICIEDGPLRRLHCKFS